MEEHLYRELLASVAQQLELAADALEDLLRIRMYEHLSTIGELNVGPRFHKSD